MVNARTSLDKGVTKSQKPSIKNPWKSENLENRKEIRRRLSSSYSRAFPGCERAKKRAQKLLECETGRVLSHGEKIIEDERGAVIDLKKCENRHCPTCARRHGRRSFVRVADKIGITDGKLQPEKCRFITLTRRSLEGETFAHQLGEIRKGWRKLRRRSFFQNHVEGWIFKIETTFSTPYTRRRANLRKAFFQEKNCPKGWRERSEELKNRKISSGEWWNTHAHLFVFGEYLPVEELKENWGKCGKNLGHVWVTRARLDGGLSSLRETLKYSLKSFDTLILPPDLLDEYVKTTANARFFATGGSFRGCEMEGKNLLSEYVARFMEENTQKIEEIIGGPCVYKSSRDLTDLLVEGARSCTLPGASPARVSSLLQNAIAFEKEGDRETRWDPPDETADWRWSENEEMMEAAFAINAMRWEKRREDREERRAIRDAAEKNSTYILEGRP